MPKQIPVTFNTLIKHAEEIEKEIAPFFPVFCLFVEYKYIVFFLNNDMLQNILLYSY